MTEPHPQRCKTCEFLWKHECPYYKAVDVDGLVGITCDSYIEFTSYVGCASHSASDPARLCDECNIIELENRLCELEQDLKDAKKASEPATGYQCGDNCRGECSGEVDGKIWCPESSASEPRADAAKQAREQVLSLLEEWDYYNYKNFLKPHPTFRDMIRLVREKPDEIKKHIESLRRQEQRP